MPLDRAGNTFSQARSLGISSGKKVFRDRIDQGDRKDFYTFTLTKSSNVRLRLNKLKGNLDLNLFDAQGNLIAKSRKKKNKAEKIKQKLEVGTYYIQVKRKGGNSAYKLKTVLREASAGGSLDPIIPTVDPKDTDEESEETKAQRTAFINEVLELTNVERRNKGLSGLTLNQRLNSAAQTQSKGLAEGDVFSHTSGPTGTLAERLQDKGYDYAAAGENIAAGQSSAKQVVREWMESPSHRKNILDPDFTELGVGYFFLENDTGNINYNHYWTQNFGTPMD
ncbi:MAG: CAP domain-containing protein [Cyanobacteria bacterium P01_F01_bin.150]